MLLTAEKQEDLTNYAQNMKQIEKKKVINKMLRSKVYLDV